jgi:hypothetical protein
MNDNRELTEAQQVLKALLPVAGLGQEEVLRRVRRVLKEYQAGGKKVREVYRQNPLSGGFEPLRFNLEDIRRGDHISFMDYSTLVLGDELKVVGGPRVSQFQYKPLGWGLEQEQA